MLGKDLYRIENNVELSSERLSSLVVFYLPLIGSDALALYEFLAYGLNSLEFNELNILLSSYNISIDRFEETMNILNQYHLVKTFRSKNEDRYVFVVNNPLSMKEFINDSILVRDFILKNSGTKYQNILASMNINNHDLSDYEDVSKKPDLSHLNEWNPYNETYVNKPQEKHYDFNTFFDVNTFLKDISVNLLPMRYRTYDNMKELALLADLYNVSYDKMRTFLPEVAKSNSNDFDLNLLKYKCMNSQNGYEKVENDDYNTPCLNFLMSLQDGKEVTPYDKKIIYTLAHDYSLNPSVINVLLSHALKNCDNHLYEKYIYPIASDLHRNNINSASDALNRLKSEKRSASVKKDVLPDYDDSNNPEYSEERLLEILSRKGNRNG